MHRFCVIAALYLVTVPLSGRRRLGVLGTELLSELHNYRIVYAVLPNSIIYYAELISECARAVW